MDEIAENCAQRNKSIIEDKKNEDSLYRMYLEVLHLEKQDQMMFTRTVSKEN